MGDLSTHSRVITWSHGMYYGSLIKELKYFDSFRYSSRGENYFTYLAFSMVEEDCPLKKNFIEILVHIHPK